MATMSCNHLQTQNVLASGLQMSTTQHNTTFSTQHMVVLEQGVQEGTAFTLGGQGGVAE